MSCTTQSRRVSPKYEISREWGGEKEEKPVPGEEEADGNDDREGNLGQHPLEPWGRKWGRERWGQKEGREERGRGKRREEVEIKAQ